MDLSRITWRKASRSSTNGGACVEVGAVARMVAVRDSKDPGGPALAVTPKEWRAFTDLVKAGAHDLA